jgi:hypothetical protein
LVAAVVGVVVDGGSDWAGGDVAVSDGVGDQVAAEDVVDEFSAASVDAAEALRFGDAVGKSARAGASGCSRPWRSTHTAVDGT